MHRHFAIIQTGRRNTQTNYKHALSESEICKTSFSLARYIHSVPLPDLVQNPQTLADMNDFQKVVK